MVASYSGAVRFVLSHPQRPHEQVSAAMDECPVFDLAHANAFLKQLGGKRLAKAEAVMTIVRAPKLRRSLMRPIAPEGDARFANKLDHANAATYSDEAGWKSSVVPKRAGRILGRYALARGGIYIPAPSGETRRSHFWMDRLELRGDRRRRGVSRQHCPLLSHVCERPHRSNTPCTEFQMGVRRVAAAGGAAV
jgi:hypothetical protein